MLPEHLFLNLLDYSRGQAKPTNKNGNLVMAEKMLGKHADRLREARGQFSSQS